MGPLRITDEGWTMPRFVLFAGIIAGRQFILRTVAPMLLATAASAMDPGESIELDEKTGDYVIRYVVRDDSNAAVPQQVVFVPATKIRPVITAGIAVDALTDKVAFRYLVRNEVGAAQPLERISMRIVQDVDAGDQESPEGWRHNSHSLEDGGYGAYWWPEDGGSLEAGTQLYGFGLRSVHLPGIAVVRFQGGSAANAWFDESDLSDELGEILYQINANNFVARYVPVPLIRVSSPLDAGEILAGVRDHLLGDLVRFDLIDTALASELDRLLQRAIGAAGQPGKTGLFARLQSIRDLLLRECPGCTPGTFPATDGQWRNSGGRISPLAAAVLIFDVEFLAGRG